MKNLTLAIPLLTSLLTLLPSPARADWKDHLHQQAQRVALAQLPANAEVLSKTREGLFDQKIDHANSADPRTFRQRFWVNLSLAQGPGSPVLYYICGEGPCHAAEFAGAALDLARRYHAILVTLEHRYYGASQPFNDLSSANLRYLTVDNALADLAAFQDHARERMGFRGKWITMGGSYPGALSAYYRMRYPNKVVGALASSAPVEARVNFEEYDHAVYLKLDPACRAGLRSVTASIEAGLADPRRARALLEQFEIGQVRDPRELLYVIADAAAGAVQYGYTDAFCRAVLAPGDPIANYARFTVASFANQGGVYLDTFESAMTTRLGDAINRVGGRQWTYQSCAEFGFYQTAFHDPEQATRSARLDVAYNAEMCRKLFGLAHPPDERAMNARYLAPLLDARTTNILFTNGADDPWARLSITVERGNGGNPNLSLFTILGGSHCNDLSGRGPGPQAAIRQAQELFAKLIGDWL